jgi:crossover junction endodeoxyribonuclease RusA
VKPLTFTLQWPPSVNNYYTVARGRKILSARGRAYQAAVAAHLLGMVRTRRFTVPVRVAIVAHQPDNRKRDLDNTLKPTLDSLVKAGVLKDDSLIHALAIGWGENRAGGSLTVTVEPMSGAG